jgi:hypothetical protein
VTYLIWCFYEIYVLLFFRADTAAVTVESIFEPKTYNTVLEITTLKEPRTSTKGWSDLFRYLVPNDGANDPGLYKETDPPGPARTEL